MSKRPERSKARVIAGLVETRRQIIEAACTIPFEQQEFAFVGSWSIKDLLAHLAGWDYTNLEGVREMLAGNKPAFLARHDRDWKTYNAMLVEQRRCDDFGEMIAAVRRSQDELVAFLEPLSDDDFGRVVRVNTFRMSIAALLNFEIRDEKVHLEQIRKFFTPQEAGESF